MHIDKNKTGLTFGLLFGSFHLAWGLLVAFGVAQSLIDFILSLHMIDLSVTVLAFSVVITLELVVATFVVGYVFGWLMAFFWNKCFK